jgi:hypothetical protein
VTCAAELSGCDYSAEAEIRRAEGEGEMMARLKELEEMAANLQATARELPPGQDRYNALREIGRFRARITGLQGADLRGLKAKGK